MVAEVPLVVKSPEVKMVVRLSLCCVLLTRLTSPGLALPQLFSPGRSCSLVRSSTRSGSDCFSEPECRQECRSSVSRQVCGQPSSGCYVQQCRAVGSEQCRQQQQCSLVYDVKYVLAGQEHLTVLVLTATGSSVSP